MENSHTTTWLRCLLEFVTLISHEFLSALSHVVFTAQAERQIACKSKPFPIWLQERIASVQRCIMRRVYYRTKLSHQSPRDAILHPTLCIPGSHWHCLAMPVENSQAQHPTQGSCWVASALLDFSEPFVFHQCDKKSSLLLACICYADMEERIKIFKCWGTYFFSLAFSGLLCQTGTPRSASLGNLHK